MTYFFPSLFLQSPVFYTCVMYMRTVAEAACTTTRALQFCRRSQTFHAAALISQDLWSVSLKC